MNKKFLSAILFSALFAGTGTFTSCIDNEAPEGIEELRGATAELIRAKAAVEQAKVQSEAANAAYIQAQAKIAEAQAAHEQAKADKVKAETEMALAQNEIEIALLQQQLAAAEQEMELAAKQMEVEMKNIEASLLQAEAAYLEAESALALLKATMTQAEADKVAALKGALATAKANLATAEDNLFNANQSLYLAMLDKEGDNSEAVFKLNLSLAEKALVAAQAEEAEAKALAEKDVEATEWEKEAEELRAKAKNLEGAVLDSLNVVYEKIAANHKTDWDKVEETNAARWEAANEEYPVSKYENKSVEKNAAVKSLIPSMAGYANGIFSYGVDDETFRVSVSVEDDVMAVESTSADSKLEMVENWIEKLGEITIDPNTTAANQLLLAGAEKSVETAEEAYEKAVAAWTIAKNAYVDGTFVTVPTTEYQAVVTAYNANVEALAAAITAYNTKYAEIKTAGEDAAVTEKKAELKKAEYQKQLVQELGTIGKGTQAENVVNTGVNVIANLEYMFTDYPAGATDAVKKQYADAFAKAKADTDYEVGITYAKLTAAEIATIKAAGADKALKAAVGKDKALTVAKKAVDDAAAKLTAAKDKAGSYAALEAAIAAYDALTKVPYAQTLTADAITATDGMTANATYAKKTAGITVDAVEYASVYEIKTSTVTAEEFTKATATKKLEGAALETVWKSASEAAFGYNDRVIALTDLTNLKPGDTTSAVAKLVAAQNNLKGIQDKIAVAETLTALVAELTAQKAVLVAEIENAEDAVEAAQAAYAEQLAAYDELFEEVLKAQEETKHLVATYNRIANELETAVGNYYAGLDFEYVNMNGITETVNAGNAEELAAWFENWYVVAQKKAIEAQGAVQEAQVDLKKYQEGKYDAVALATRNVEKMQAAYDEAKAEYDAALEALNNVLALISAE